MWSLFSTETRFHFSKCLFDHFWSNVISIHLPATKTWSLLFSTKFATTSAWLKLLISLFTCLLRRYELSPQLSWTQNTLQQIYLAGKTKLMICPPTDLHSGNNSVCSALFVLRRSAELYNRQFRYVKPFPHRLWFFAFCRNWLASARAKFCNTGFYAWVYFVVAVSICIAFAVQAISDNFSAVFVLIFYFVCRNQ